MLESIIHLTVAAHQDINMTFGMQVNHNQWEGQANLGPAFGIEWQRLFDLPFSETESLRNPLNEDKTVKISRDGQELPPDIGEALVNLFEEGAERAGIPRPGTLVACLLMLIASHHC